MLEIILIILGLMVFTVSFFLPAGKKGTQEDVEQISEDTIREMVEKEVEGAKSQISDIVDETITYAMEKTERSMDRLTNEKMMAVNEYSDTVLEQINKNHSEVVFLYDMLNDKHENLKSTVSEAVKTVSEVRQTVKDAEVTAKEAESTAKEAEERAREVKEIVEEQDFKPFEVERVELPIAEPVKQEVLGEAAEQVIQPAPKKPGRKPRKTVTVQEETAKDNMAATVNREEVQSAREIPAPEEVPEVAVSLNGPGRGGRNSNERILELHKAGKSNMAIARELGLGIGEVKLVIDLFEGI